MSVAELLRNISDYVPLQGGYTMSNKANHYLWLSIIMIVALALTIGIAIGTKADSEPTAAPTAVVTEEPHGFPSYTTEPPMPLQAKPTNCPLTTESPVARPTAPLHTESPVAIFETEPPINAPAPSYQTEPPAAAAIEPVECGPDYGDDELFEYDHEYGKLRLEFYSVYPYTLTAHPEHRTRFIELFLKVEPTALELYPWLTTTVSEEDSEPYDPEGEFSMIMWNFVHLLEDKFYISKESVVYYKSNNGLVPLARF